MSGWYDRQGRPIDVNQAAELGKNWDYKVLQRTTLPGGRWVSTVWLGLDHRYGEGGKPLIFETMVFPKDSMGEEDCEQYATEIEAYLGHRRMVRKWMTSDV